MFFLTIYEKIQRGAHFFQSASVFAEEAQTFPSVCIIMYSAGLLNLAAASGATPRVPGRSPQSSGPACVQLMCSFNGLFVFLSCSGFRWGRTRLAFVVLNCCSVDQTLALFFLGVIRLTGRARKYQAPCVSVCYSCCGDRIQVLIRKSAKLWYEAHFEQTQVFRLLKG